MLDKWEKYGSPKHTENNQDYYASSLRHFSSYRNESNNKLLALNC